MVSTWFDAWQWVVAPHDSVSVLTKAHWKMAYSDSLAGLGLEGGKLNTAISYTEPAKTRFAV